jgi:hypothetical protein
MRHAASVWPPVVAPIRCEASKGHFRSTHTKMQKANQTDAPPPNSLHYAFSGVLAAYIFVCLHLVPCSGSGSAELSYFTCPPSVGTQIALTIEEVMFRDGPKKRKYRACGQHSSIVDWEGIWRRAPAKQCACTQGYLHVSTCMRGWCD